MDKINNQEDDTLISGTSGDDSIKNVGNTVEINSGAGNDSIYNDYCESVTINSGAGNDNIKNGGFWDDGYHYGGSNVTINTGDGNDSVYNWEALNVTINTGAGDDSVDNSNSYYVTINTGAGNDSIINYNSNYVTINTGDDNDYVHNFSGKVTINTSDGNDSVWNEISYYVTINTGDGNDSVRNGSDRVTISGDKGNDSIYNACVLEDDGSIYYYDYSCGNNILFKYNSGDGNDVIYGFKADSTLEIGGGSYSTEQIGDDIIVTVGDGKISLIGAAGLSKVNITDTESGSSNYKLITLTEGNDIYINSVEGATIQALGGDDSIQNGCWWYENGAWTWHEGGSNVTINTGDGNDSIENYGDSVTINTGAGNDNIKNGGLGYDGYHYGGSSVTINTGAGNDYVYNGFDNELVTINTGAGNDSVENRGDSVTISGGNGNDSIYNSGSKVIISGGNGNDSIYNNWDFEYNKPYRNYNKDNGSNVLFNYSSGDGNDKIYGFRADSTLSICGSSYSTTKSGKNIIVTVGDGKISLISAATLDAVNIDFEKTVEENSWKLSGTTATYGNLVTVSGVKSTSGLSISGKVVTVSKSAVNASKITISDGYTLKLADDVAITSTKNAWSLSGTTATYKQTTKAGYKLASDAKSISYSKAATKTLVTVSGVKSTNGLSVSGKVVTVSKSAVNASKITISDGYTLKLADDVAITSTKNAWSLRGTTATYKQTTKAGYKLASDAKSISYSKAATKTLTTITGVKDTNGLSVSGKVVTVSKSAVNASKITISDGYTLKLASDVTKTSTKNAWSLSGTTATYKQTTKAGYKLASDAKSISYSKAATKTLVTVSGVKSTNGLSVSGKVVTVAKSALNARKITISRGYTLKLSDDVAITSTKKAWSKIGTTAKYNQTTTAGYKLANNVITYTKKATKALAAINGVKSTKGLSVSKNIITLKNVALNKKVTISSGYEFDFAADYGNATISGTKNDNKITARGKKISINGCAGNDLIKMLGSGTVNGGSGADIFYLNPKVANVIADYAEEDKISLSSGSAEIEKSGDDVIFNGKITVKGGADKVISYVDAGGEQIYQEVQNEEIILSKSYKKDSYTLSDGLLTLDASAVTHDLTIIGNKESNKIVGTPQDDIINGNKGADTILGGNGNDSLVGGAGNDSINGGAGNDSLWGGAGNDTLISGKGYDVFLYKEGDGTVIIDDFDDNFDKILVLSGAVNNPNSDNSGDVTFDTESGQIIVKNGADKYIPIYYTDFKHTTTRYNP